MEKFNCHVFEMSDAISELVKKGSGVPLYISGSSMNPFLISRRDIVWLREFTDSDLNIGKIVLFKRTDGSLVLHRIIKKMHDGKFLVNGDAQTWSEEVKAEQIIAVVSDIQRKGKIRLADSCYWKIVDTLWRMLTPFRSVIMRVWFKLKRMKSN